MSPILPNLLVEHEMYGAGCSQIGDMVTVYVLDPYWWAGVEQALQTTESQHWDILDTLKRKNSSQALQGTFQANPALGW